MKKGYAKLQSTVQLPFYVCDWCTKEWRKTEHFQVTYSCFSMQNAIAKNWNTWQSNIPPELPSSQPESFHAKGKGVGKKGELKRTVLSEFLTMEATNTWKIYTGNNNQTY